MVKFGWDKLKRFLAQANTWSGTQTFANAVIQAGSVAASVVVDLVSELAAPPAIGGTTPAAGYFSPTISKGPATVTTFAGTVSTSGSSTTITWSSAADAILAGYNATNPVLGTTIITGAIKQASVTRYIVSWTNATACVVDSVCTLAAATELTSVQLPIATFVNSAGVTTGWMNAVGQIVSFVNDDISGISTLADAHINVKASGANGAVRFWVNGAETARISSTGNILTGGLTAAGTSAAKVLAMGGGTMPTALVANAVQIGVAEYNGATGDQRLNIYSEATVAKKTAIGSGTVSINGAVTSGGGFTRQLAEAASAALSGATGSIAVNVPTGARILGVQLRVDTAITSDNVTKTWAADYVNTPTTAITSGKAFAKDTVFTAIHPAYEITTGTVTITITAAAGAFTAGVVRAICYFEAIDAMIAAP